MATLVQQISNFVTRSTTEFNAIRALTGKLSDLTTTNNTNLVSAINEAASTGGGAGATNLTATAAPGSVTINSDTGTDATISPADGTNAGVFLPAEKTKLSAIEALADVTDAVNVAASIHGVSTKGAPVAADELAMIDSEASNALKKVTYAVLANAIAAQIIDDAPSTLDTLNELAAALGDDPAFATTVNTALGNRVRVDTATQGLNSTQQSNARTNIGAQAAADIGDTTTDFVAIFEAGLA